MKRENSTDRRRRWRTKAKGDFRPVKERAFFLSFTRSRVARPSLLLPPLFFSSICPARSRAPVRSFFFLHRPPVPGLVGGRQCARARGPCGTWCCYARRWRSRSWSRPTLRLLTVSTARAFFLFSLAGETQVFSGPIRTLLDGQRYK